MNKYFGRYTPVFLFLLFLFIPTSQIHAQTSLTVSMSVGDTNLTFNGKTVPNSNVTFIESGAVIGTTLSGTDGSFSKDFLAMDPGIHNISIYATDPDLNYTSTVVYSLSLSPNTTTMINDVYLPPTISINKGHLNTDEALRVSGYATPGFQVLIYFENSGKTYSADPDINGFWTKKINLTDFGAKTYKVFAKLVNGDNVLSEESLGIEFIVRELTSSETETTTTSSSENTTGSVTPTGCETTNLLLLRHPFLDENSNCIIDIEEIYDAVKFWVDSWRGDKHDNCDLNGDFICNIKDFSITLYYINK